MLTEDEVRRIIADMSHGKALGPDGIPSDVIKLGKKVLVPFLNQAFSSVSKSFISSRQFQRSHYGRHSGIEQTESQQPSELPPIALLVQTGKILEKIIAQRLREVVETNNLLPNLQFGGPGGCTTKALQYIRYLVYKGWCYNILSGTTLMSLNSIRLPLGGHSASSLGCEGYLGLFRKVRLVVS